MLAPASVGLLAISDSTGDFGGAIDDDAPFSVALGVEFETPESDGSCDDLGKCCMNNTALEGRAAIQSIAPTVVACWEGCLKSCWTCPSHKERLELGAIIATAAIAP